MFRNEYKQTCLLQNQDSLKLATFNFFVIFKMRLFNLFFTKHIVVPKVLKKTPYT